MKKDKIKVPLQCKQFSWLIKDLELFEVNARESRSRSRQLLTEATGLIDADAQKIDCGISVRNIRNSIRSIVAYCMMTDMLIDQIKEDINNIRTRQKLHVEQIERQRAENDRKLKEAANLREKRKAEKSAEEENNN